MAETSQSATGPYVAMADAGSALNAWTAAFREAVLVKVPGGDDGGDGGEDGCKGGVGGEGGEGGEGGSGAGAGEGGVGEGGGEGGGKGEDGAVARSTGSHCGGQVTPFLNPSVRIQRPADEAS